MRFTILLVLSLFLAACAVSNSGNYAKATNSWMGAKASDLLAALGKPYETVNGRAGSAVYVYRRQTIEPSSINYSPRIGTRTNGIPVIAGMPNANTPNNQALTTNCFTTYTANASGIITSVKVAGSNCGSGTANNKGN